MSRRLNQNSSVLEVDKRREESGRRARCTAEKPGPMLCTRIILQPRGFDSPRPPTLEEPHLFFFHLGQNSGNEVSKSDIRSRRCNLQQDFPAMPEVSIAQNFQHKTYLVLAWSTSPVARALWISQLRQELATIRNR
jgi:hypothetical protein